MQLKVYSSVPLKEVKNGHREQLMVSATLGNNRSLRQVGRFHFFFFSYCKGNMGKTEVCQSIKIRMRTPLLGQPPLQVHH